MKSSSFGGVVPILRKLKALGVPEVIRQCLGKRDHRAQYSYEDIFISWVLTSLCGGTSLHHISNLQEKLAIIPGLKLPSHDTLGRVMKRLATETMTNRVISNHGQQAKIIFTEYNENGPLNKMLVQTTKQAGALQENKSYTLDIDCTFIPTECRGAVRKRNEKTGKIDTSRLGFNPMICLIGSLPVYVSMRDGYSGPKFKFADCLSNCITLLDDAKIKVGRVISDAAGYNKEAFEYLEGRGIKFVVRFPFQMNMETFKLSLMTCENWKDTEIRTANFNWRCEIGSVLYKMHDRPESGHISPTWRIVALRKPTAETLGRLNPDELERSYAAKKKLNQLLSKKLLKEEGKPYADSNWKEIDGYEYKFFITNDYDAKPEHIVLEYNQRGTSERQFSFMKKDFAWHLPPFMNMNENTVFMIAAALANNIFRAMINQFKNAVPQLKDSFRLRAFQQIFINVSCLLMKRKYVFLNTPLAFEKIM